MTKIIGIAGAINSGKNTAADYLEREFGFKQLGFADPLKRFLVDEVHIPFEYVYTRKKEEVIPGYKSSARTLLQKLGTEWGRELIHEQIWAEVLIKKSKEYSLVVVEGLRFDNEAKIILDNGGQVWQIIGRESPKQETHVSEKGVSENLVDITINNNSSLEDFFQKIKYFAEIYLNS